MHKQKLRAQIRKAFALETSCHGLAQIYSSSNKKIRFLWTVLVLTVCVMLIWQVVDRCKAYFSYNTQIQISKKFRDELPFPAITICNYNRYFNLSPEEREALNTLSYVYDYGIISIRESNRLNRTINFFEQQGNDFNLTSYLISKAWQLNNVTVPYCAVSGYPICSAANFTPAISITSGQCWTFDTNTVQKKRGRVHGFDIVLFVDQLNFNEDPLTGKNEVGILFHVHPKHEPPRVREVGQSVGVGLWGTVAVHKQRVTNMFQPWGNCEPSKEELEFSSVYSVAACVNECFDRRLIEECGCRDLSVTGFSDISECSAMKSLTCAGPYRSFLESEINPSDCECAQACNEEKYRTSVSYSTFPNQASTREFSYTVDDNVTLQDFRENLVGLTFYFDDLSMTTFVESKTISETALLSDIGGQLGLWIGVSIVTLFEFIQFFIKLLQTTIYRKE